MNSFISEIILFFSQVHGKNLSKLSQRLVTMLFTSLDFLYDAVCCLGRFDFSIIHIYHSFIVPIIQFRYFLLSLSSEATYIKNQSLVVIVNSDAVRYVQHSSFLVSVDEQILWILDPATECKDRQSWTRINVLVLWQQTPDVYIWYEWPSKLFHLLKHKPVVCLYDDIWYSKNKTNI